MASILLSALVPVNPVGAGVLQNPLNVGNYGTTDQDVVINGAQADQQNDPLPAAPQVLQWDHAFIPWNKNPIDRADYPNPVVPPANATFSNRNKILSLLKLFMLQAAYRPNVTFQVSRVGTVIYYLDGPLNDAPGPELDVNGQPAADQPGGYGIPFENLIAANADPHLEKYFVFQSYSLLGVTELLIRTEVDCENQAGEITEIKSKKTPNNPNFTIWTDAAYFRTVWAQMLFGCTQSLVIGVYGLPNNNQLHPPATFTSINVRTFAQVEHLAGMDNGNDVAPLSLLAALIEWIRSNIADGETKTFSFAKNSQRLTLA